ncbi:DUF1801 domain-containing protein [Algirhabdus cladophorae]|uniref:DUF1801 domain-containing protein n=1 Tax=Algirhabdus cladophorae TaxID=3377108 RepID=UPI003B845FD2
MSPALPADIARIYDAFPADIRAALLDLRCMIFDVAAVDARIGTVQETVKWGTPAYLTHKPKSGTTIRLGQPKTGGYAIYTHCQTPLITEFQAQFPTEFSYDGGRAILLDPLQDPSHDLLQMFISRALTYHLPKA